jgi:hypothetical protein
MNQQRVVQEFDRNRGSHGVFEVGTEEPRRCETDARSKHLSAPAGVVREQFVQVVARRVPREPSLELPAHKRPIFVEHFLDQTVVDSLESGALLVCRGHVRA